MTPFSEVLIGKENVILTVKQVVMDARARRSSSLVDIIITTKNHISPSAETLMKFDSETGLMHRKVSSTVPSPVSFLNRNLYGLVCQPRLSATPRLPAITKAHPCKDWRRFTTACSIARRRGHPWPLPPQAS